MYLKDMGFRVGCTSMSKLLKIALNNGDFLREIL
jgi:hypothetical protein